uniref:Uncharacterized protein n=1 Tax=viral metagenome TaxID=1070528 RepID=A0A6M3LGH9_9ZZZZ
MSTDIDHEVETVETEDRDHALARVEAEGDPELMLAHLEKKAQLATRYRQAVEAVLLSQTYPKDWTIQGEKACLSSAGAERVGRSFPIKIEAVTWKKEELTDQHGAGYRYIYSGYATLYDRRVFVHGSYSTRDKFLGFAHDEWKDPADINEGHIRNAAYHVFCGNAVKELLGLRGIPEEEYRRMMGATGRDADKSSTVQRGKGTRGGSQASGDDKSHQKELAETCVSFANAGFTVEQDGDGNWSLVPFSEADERPPLEVAKDICIQLSGFEGDKGYVKGKLASQLTGKWLNATLGKVRKLAESMPGEEEGPAPWDK